MKNNYEKYSIDIINGMIDWVRVIDKDHNIVFMNKSMKDQLGDCTGMKCYRGIGLDNSCPNCITDETLKTGKIHTKEEKVGDRTFSVASSPIRDKNGRVSSAVEVFRDITKEKMLEQKIISQNIKLNANLSFAKTLQRKMLPRKGVVNGSVSIDYLYIPSEMLGGDLFDVFPLDDNNTAIYIFDIAGHGVMSSMITMFVRQTVRALAEGGCSPSMVLEGLLDKFNRLGLEQDSFITILYGEYNSDSSTFIYSNGGHNPPLLLRNGGTHFAEGAGIPVCCLGQDYHYEEYTLKMEKEDCLYLYTDGITEVRNISGQFLGLEGLARAVIRDKRMESIVKTVCDFSGGRLFDDIALIEVKIL